MSSAEFAQRLDQLQERIAEAAVRSGRTPDEITLIGVSKRKSLIEMQQAYDAGLRHFGENRAQEVRDKFPLFAPAGIIRHFIGHLQSNKVKYLPGRVDLIHTIDTETIAAAIEHKFAEQALVIPVLVEVNISGETAKAGVSPRQALALAAYCSQLPHLDLQGLMTIGPLTGDPFLIRRAFREMKLLADQIERQVGVSTGRAVLSMGMSGDFETAIEEGATHVRVGTALFGPRLT